MIPSGLYCLHSPELYKKPNKQGFSFLIRPQRKDLRILLTKKKIIDLKFFLIQFNDNRLGKNHFYKYIQYCPSFIQPIPLQSSLAVFFATKSKPNLKDAQSSLLSQKANSIKDSPMRESVSSWFLTNTSDRGTFANHAQGKILSPLRLRLMQFHCYN